MIPSRCFHRQKTVIKDTSKLSRHPALKKPNKTRHSSSCLWLLWPHKCLWGGLFFWLKLLIYCLNFHQIRTFCLIRTFTNFFPRMSFHLAQKNLSLQLHWKRTSCMYSPGNFTKFYRIPFQKQAIADILLYKYS